MTCSGGDSAQGADEAAAARAGAAGARRPRTPARLARAAAAGGHGRQPARLHGDDLGRRARRSASWCATLGEDPAIGQVLVFYDQPHGLTGAPEESWRAVREGVMLGAALSPVPVMVSSTLPELLDDAAAWRVRRRPGCPPPPGCAPGCGAPPRRGWRRRARDRARLREIAAAARAAVAGAARPTASWLPEHEAKELLRAAGVAVPYGRAVVGEDDAVAALARARRPGGAQAERGARAAQDRARRGRAGAGLRERRPRARTARWPRSPPRTTAWCWPSGWPRPASS